MAVNEEIFVGRSSGGSGRLPAVDKTLALVDHGGVFCVRCPLRGWTVDLIVRDMGGACGDCSRLSVCCLDDQLRCSS